MRLLFAIKGLVIAGGGAERVFVDVANALAACGHDVHVATFDKPGQALFYDLDPAIPVHLLGAGDPGVPTPRSNLPKIMIGIRKLARELKPDAAVAFMHSTYVPVAFGLMGTGVPLVLSEHTSAAHFNQRPLQRALVRLVQKRSYAKTVVSDVIRSEHPPHWRDNIVVVPNPVDMDTFRRAQTIAPEKLVLCVGGLRFEKGQEVLIEAFDRIAGNHPDWRLRLVGDGVTRPQIEKQVSQSIHGDRIEIAGVQKNVAREYARAAFAVVPSRYESLALVAVEAMASGRPVIGFADCAGPAKLIDDGINGLLVDPGDDRAGALAEAMDRMIRVAELRQSMGSRAPETVIEYSADAVIAQWEKLLSAAAHGSPIPAGSA
ncbi:glycosyltransferase family 4 protein [Parerythrobacter lacustris]|uniref:Glycosyltransferase family 4 protein n=1 Tax=Parerythrobacter lacustris TaxID=2969984 RepID=A0ABT1XRW2_9SPHN|nr:glycosyltransferase family 4 protein [Parerythrobacter lacustris]MCR2834399.1 glycosyltransferase family 4 protein [Parerythrobacter lacustris]